MRSCGKTPDRLVNRGHDYHVNVIVIRCLITLLGKSQFSGVFSWHYNDDKMSAMASQITSLSIVYSTVYSCADERKHQSSASLVFVREIHRWPVNSPHKAPVTRKMFPFDDVITNKNRSLRRACIRSQKQSTYSESAINICGWMASKNAVLCSESDRCIYLSLLIYMCSEEFSRNLLKHCLLDTKPSPKSKASYEDFG